MAELVDGWRLVRKKTNSVLIGFGPKGGDDYYQASHEWTLVSGPFWRRQTIPVFRKDGHLMEKLHGSRKGFQASQLLARGLIALHTVEAEWKEFAAANTIPLQVEATSHRSYSYERKVRQLSWRDDLEAPTPPSPTLARHRQMRGFGMGKLKVARFGPDKDTEEYYQSQVRTPDIRILRPDLFQEIEPYVLTFMDRGKEALASLKKTRKAADDILWKRYKDNKREIQMSAVPNVLSGAQGLNDLEKQFNPPGVEEIEDLTR